MTATIDHGLQAERTILAWWRTALTAVVAGVLVVREAYEGSTDWAFVVISALAIVALITIAVRRVSALARRTGDPGVQPTSSAVLFTAAALTLQVVAVVLVLR